MYVTVNSFVLAKSSCEARKESPKKEKNIARSQVLDATTSCLLDWRCYKLCLGTDLIVRI